MAFFLSSLNWKSQPKGISGVKTNLRRFNRKMSNEEIKFDALNYRTHDEKNLKLIKKSLKELGAGRSIVIDSEGEIIAGNATYKQAQELGLPVQVIETDGKRLIVVKRTDLKTQDKKRKRLALMDNSTSDKVQWDFDHIAADFDLSELPDFGIEALPGLDISAEGFPSLAEGDAGGFEQITFTLSHSQAEKVKEALKKAQKSKEYKFCDKGINSNKNANALFCIVEAYLHER